MRLIDADALGLDINRKANENFPANRNLTLYAESLLAHAPTIDAVPVVHGRWGKAVNVWEESPTSFCSCCGQGIADECIPWFKYCSNCGARMDGE